MGPPGHFGIAFAAKVVAPKAPLWSLLVASEALDLLSVIFIITGVEKIAVSKNRPKPGSSNDRTWFGALVPRSFNVRYLVTTFWHGCLSDYQEPAYQHRSWPGGLQPLGT